MTNPIRILIMGLPGAGKTTLARALARRIQAVHFNADEIRATLNRDLGFSHVDRITQARRMGQLCHAVNREGFPAIADLVCPTPQCRDAFAFRPDLAPPLVVFVDRIKNSRYTDTDNLFIPPLGPHFTVTGDDTAYSVDRIISHFNL